MANINLHDYLVCTSNKIIFLPANLNKLFSPFQFMICINDILFIIIMNLSIKIELYA